MIRWFNEAWSELRREDVRPSAAQWSIGAIAGIIAGCAAAAFGQLRGMNPFASVAIPLGVVATGMIIANCVGLNVRRSMRRSRASVGLVLIATVILAFVAAFGVIGPRQLLVGALAQPAILMFPLAFLVPIVLSFARNPPDDRPVCSRCDYPFVEINPPKKCPECGSKWLARGGTKLPKPRLSRRAIFVGVLIFVLANSLMFLSLFPSPRWLPTTLLRWTATSNSFRADLAFAELSKRTLTPAHTRELAQHLLDRSRTDILTPRSGMLWLEGLAVSGSLPPDLRQRYFEEMRIPVLKVSPPITAGQQAAAVVGFNNRAFIAPGVDAYVFVHTFVVTNDDGTPLPAQTSGLDTVQQGMAAIWSAPFQPKSSPSDVSAPAVRSQFPNLTFAPEKPGRYRVHAEVWSVAMPTPLGVLLQPQFDAQGVLIAPQGALFVKRFDLEEFVEVRPAPAQRPEPTMPANPPKPPANPPG